MIRTFDRSARAVVIAALQRARIEATNEIREEHLLAAVLAEPSAQRILGTATPDIDALVTDIRNARRRAGITVAEADALADIGIDVDVVVGRIEAELGAGALDDSRRSTRRRTTMSPPAKLVLQAAQRQAIARGDRSLTAEHLLLGLLAQPGAVADALAARGITVGTVVAGLDERPPRTG